jgi:hypothetical protein
MRKVNYEQIKNVLNGHYTLKKPLIIYGAFGIGKSGLVECSSNELASKEKREFKNFFKAKSDEQNEIINNPSRYFSLLDIRMSERDVSDIKGLMSLSEKEEFIKYKTERWLDYITKEDSSGILFFDEFNLASPMVLSNIYKIVYDRIVNDTLLSNNWLIVMAGNRDGVDGAYTFSVPKPLRDRASEVELVADFEGWRDWAIDKGLHHSVITYLSNSQTHFYLVDDKDGQKFSTPRGWERVSDFQNSKLNDKEKNECIKSTISEGIAIQYLKYCELQDKMDLEKILKNPKEIGKIEDISIKYLLVGICADRYKNNDKQVDINKIMDISKELDSSQNAEFVSLLWKLCINYTKDTKKFRNDFMKIKDISLLEKYKGYIL